LGATSGDKSVMQLMMEADVDRTQAMAERDDLEEEAAAMAAEGETDSGGGCLDDPAAAVAAREAAETAAAALADVYARLDAMGADAAPERARAVLRGLRFTAPQVDGPVSALSGGWRVGPGRYRPPRHQHAFEPSLLKLNGIL